MHFLFPSVPLTNMTSKISRHFSPLVHLIRRHFIAAFIIFKVL